MLTITKPTLVLDKAKCLTNIEGMVAKANSCGMKLRPHFKTHQSQEIGRWFKERGVTSCTVSSLEMAAYFAKDKWIDITVAFPVNYLEIDRINSLAGQIKLNLLVSVPGVIPKLIAKLENHVGILIDIDTGYHRTGLDPSDHDSIDKIIEEIQASHLLKFVGFLSHAGHTYKCRDTEGVKAMSERELKLLSNLKNYYEPKFPQLTISVGDTPSASIAENFEGANEIRPGNFVFYDLTQHLIGSCTVDQIAVALVCPVVATYPQRKEIIIHGGGVHFSKDFLIDETGKQHYGKVSTMNDHGWNLPMTSMYVKSISQEHGIISVDDEYINKIKPGDLLAVLPVHSCLMADAMGGYVTTMGETIEMMN